MPKWDDERNKLKDIFDTIRNYGLCGLVFFAGVYSFIKESSLALVSYIDTFTGFGLILFSVYLFYINTRFLNKLVRKEYKAGNVGSIFYYMVPVIISILGLHLLTYSASFVELSNGKTLGKSYLGDLRGSLMEKIEEPLTNKGCI